MKYVDRHVHTKFSPDSEADVKKYLMKAKDLGLEYVLFTDHMDFGAIDPEFRVRIDYDEYAAYMKELAEAYDMPVKIGVEIGYEKDHKAEIEAFLDSFDFDFVISSIHFGHGKDFYLGDFFDGKTQREAYMDYFEILLEMVENFTAYDVVGHLDYITRYGPYEHKYYEFKEFQGIIDEILKQVIAKEKGIEVNTSGLRGELEVAFPKDEVIARYRELGGKYISVGSDCHFNEHYMADVDATVKNLEEMGFILI